PPPGVELFHCTQVVSMEDSPVVALRQKPDNSISRCWQLLAEHKVQAIVSAGNTGAMVAGGLRLRRYLKNVRRPGIAALMPTLRRVRCVCVSAGAPKPHRHPQPRGGGGRRGDPPPPPYPGAAAAHHWPHECWLRRTKGP